MSNTNGSPVVDASLLLCGCGADCSEKSGSCRGHITATKFDQHNRYICEHLCDYHRATHKKRVTHGKANAIGEV